MKKLVYTLIKPKRIFLIVLSIFSLLLSTYNVEAAPAVCAEELLKDAEEYDGEAVLYKGEVIGDIMARQEYAWINVRDETGVIGVFCPKELISEIEQIEHKGSYGFSGDIISIRGVFHRACPQHGGDTDIHAEKITIVQRGEAISHPLEPRKVKASIVLAAIAFVLALIYMVLRRFR